MTRSHEQILSDMSAAVIEMDEERAVALSHEALEAGIEAYAAIHEGLAKGMEVVSDKYDSGEYYVPEILVCSDAMYAGIEVLKPHLKADAAGEQMRAVIGVVEGDIHDLGKNIVRIMMEAGGFEMHDLGRDVSLSEFVDKAEEVGADLICMSTLMTTTMPGMETVVKMLEERGVRDKYRVMIGGGPISQAYCEQIGADGYAKDASGAVRLARELGGVRV